MPRVISYTPAWLKRPSPGSKVFLDDALGNGSPVKPSTSTSNDGTYYGAHKKVAKRGLEVFVAVRNQIRWTELCQLKYIWSEEVEKKRRKKSENKAVSSEIEEGQSVSYRVSLSLEFESGRY